MALQDSSESDKIQEVSKQTHGSEMDVMTILKKRFELMKIVITEVAKTRPEALEKIKETFLLAHEDGLI